MKHYELDHTMMHVRTPRRWIGIAALGAVMSVVPSPGHAQMAKPFAEFSASALSLRDSVVAIARAQVGRRYRMGGMSPDRGFDCSGLVKYVLETLRVEVPRTSREQSRVGAAIPRDTTKLRPGDLLLFGQPKAGVSHVGIYVGNGRYVHASSVAGRVIESPLDRAPSTLVKAFKSARRILVGTDTVTSTIAARGQ
ncbi:MAG TPA: C40 family peptidase [Gemmatimonadaceae bacterium]|nr:C40 family peptidase [Gemmatimonadaceae bacterium]